MFPNPAGDLLIATATINSHREIVAAAVSAAGDRFAANLLPSRRRQLQEFAARLVEQRLESTSSTKLRESQAIEAFC